MPDTSMDDSPGGATLIPVVLAGGYGSRLWPASRRLRPKQFLPFEHGESLLQITLRRCEGLRHKPPILVCSEDHRFLVAEQVRSSELNIATVLLEPEGRNTAAAAAIASIYAQKDATGDPLLLVLPADHHMGNAAGFHSAIEHALRPASQGRLVAFGVLPHRAETGFGYIHPGDALDGNGFEVRSFVEKPDLDRATQFVEAGTHYWNSGMFLFRASAYLGELERYEPAILEACRESLVSGKAKPDRLFPFFRPDSSSFLRSPSLSLDKAVMERTDRAVVIPLDAGWSDVGSWSAIWESAEQDARGNHTRGEVLVHDVQNCLVSSDDALVGCVGVEDLIVIATPDAVLVADRRRAQDVQNLVKTLQNEDRPEITDHRQVHRPWGWFDVVDRGDRYLVKRIAVKPGARLSLQYHRHRAEHWVVVSGVAHIRNNEREYTVHENESTFIPAGSVHNLENRGDCMLQLIEIQSGDYLGEDDIVRLEDLYGREDRVDV